MVDGGLVVVTASAAGAGAVPTTVVAGLALLSPATTVLAVLSAVDGVRLDDAAFLLLVTIPVYGEAFVAP